MKNLGTPKTLDEAIMNGLQIGPMAGAPDRIHAHVKDFLAQKFGAAMMKNPECEQVLIALFNKVTEGKKWAG